MPTRTKAAKPRSVKGRIRSSPVAIIDTQDFSSSASFGKSVRRSSRIRSKKSILDSQSSHESISMSEASLVQSAAQTPQPVAGPSRLPVPHIPSTVEEEESEVETYQTIVSIGSLPDPSNYTITLMVPPSVSDKLSDNDKRDWYVKGEEMIVDAKRGKEQEGMLDRRWGVFGKGKGKQKAGDGVVWYGAGMRFPCLCAFTSLSSFTLAKSPPLNSSLTTLEPHPKPNQVPRIGANLPNWSKKENFKDIDPSLEELDEFETGWEDVPSARPQPLPVENSKRNDVTDEWERLPVQRVRSPQLGAGSSRQLTTTKHVSESLPPRQAISPIPKIDSLETLKWHKKWWREEVHSDPSYGLVFSLLPTPHSQPPPRKVPQRRSLSVGLVYHYKLPRAYYAFPDSHPYHPDLSYYCSKKPMARVYWVIPIHGPVLIPGVNYPIDLTAQDRNKGVRNKLLKGLIPSCATFTPSSTSSTPVQPFPSSSSTLFSISISQSHLQPQSSAATIHWTPPKLSWFLQKWVRESWVDDARGWFGSLSWTLAEPSVSNWVSVPETPRELGAHVCVDPSTSKAREISKNAKGAVKPQMGDHLRIYCDAERALELRLFISKAWIPTQDFSGQDRKLSEEEEAELDKERIMEKARLCLVGDRGEVLVVA
ncbi:Hypothetical Protein CGB_A9340W [Cryptococcus gattii WM276]|uniref:Uncharacterized protein n=1 Tax=Cryptococcus gattii serotype B (strain WM276 / ATCC MYA-4071) TaxID=367775 RepID=E6QYR8_CRYGW|nr:Hypothetical Protein CGB_A9340W [Cryptococcus gattii WM276]ADV19966.1 Hypothetical Protein CGB_A9340W [Cryptococcus gattii WM276]